MNRGKLVVIAMLLVGVALAAFAWSYKRSQQQRSRAFAFWGKVQAREIELAPHVELLWLTGDADRGGPPLEIAGQKYYITAQRDVTRAAGLIHARHALLEDASYDWTRGEPSAPANYTLAVRFGGDHTTTVAFDFGSRRVANVETGRSQAVVPQIIDGWRQFAARNQPH